VLKKANETHGKLSSSCIMRKYNYY